MDRKLRAALILALGQVPTRKPKQGIDNEHALKGAYATERARRIKAAQDPTTHDSPLYKEEQRSVRYQGVYSQTAWNSPTRKLSVSVHQRMRDAAQRVREREKKG